MRRVAVLTKHMLRSEEKQAHALLSVHTRHDLSCLTLVVCTHAPRGSADAERMSNISVKQVHVLLCGVVRCDLTLVVCTHAPRGSDYLLGVILTTCTSLRVSPWWCARMRHVAVTTC
jgi:hypothetical protein